MWLKLLLLTLYFFLLFLLSRILEATSWYQETGTFLSSISALDPLTLSVKKLKQLLDNRGISYSGVVEKQELLNLVEASGRPVSDELTEESASLSESSTKSTQFTCGSHFYEEVEDTKDSVWLVQVVTDDDDPKLLPEETWREVINKVSNFGVRTGIFRCSLDKRLCVRKGWTSPRLVLALPRGNKAKEDVIVHNYLHRSSSEAVLQWVRKHLASRVKVISSISELQDQWTSYNEKSKQSEIRVVFFSVLKSCPMFLSSLAIKFTGRVKFGIFHTPSFNSSYKDHLKTKSLPVYLVVTPERKFYYGSKRGESYNFKSMEIFLKSFRPEINDVFLWSLLVVNAMASFELFFISKQIWKHFLRYVVYVVKYNCTLFFVWLLILALYQFPFMATCTDALLKCLRYISGTDTAAMLRNDWKSFYTYPFLFVTFFSFAAVVGLVLRKWGVISRDEDSSLFSSWWLVPWDSGLMTYFFQPMATLTRPMAPQDLDLEVGMELLIERLAVPNLWLQPVISMDYIKELPFWKYQGWCEADDATEDNKFDVNSSSDDESANVSMLNPVSENCMCDTQSLSDNHCTNAHSSLHTSDITSQDRPVECKDTCDDDCADLPNYSNSPLLSSTSVCSPHIEKCTSQVPDVDRAPKGMLEFRECSICLESYRYSEILCGLPCGHNFHMNCIMLWLSRDNHCCPICRWPSYKPKNRVPHSHFQ